MSCRSLICFIRYQLKDKGARIDFSCFVRGNEVYSCNYSVIITQMHVKNRCVD